MTKNKILKNKLISNLRYMDKYIQEHFEELKERAIEPLKIAKIKYEKKFDAKIGEFYGIKHYEKIINESCFGYKEDGTILFCLIKENVPEEKRQIFKDIIRGVSKTPTKNRGSSAGYCRPDKMVEEAKTICNKRGEEYTDGKWRFSVYYKDENGVMSKRCQSNLARSGVAGYFDAVAGFPCRKVGWSFKNPKKHEQLGELAEIIEEAHKTKCPESYKYHLERASKIHPDLKFNNTIYSTMTLNYDFRTATHKDTGDLKEGLSTLTIFEDEPNNYEGFYLGLPDYKIAFDVRDGDTLIFDAHEKHSNTEYNVLTDKLPINKLTKNNFAGRMSVVCYCREKLDRCKEIQIR